MGKAQGPPGLRIGDVSSAEAAAEKQGVKAGVFGSMATLFDGQAGAFAYLLMVLLYMPCVAAIAAVYRETNRGWATFIGLWTTLLGYAVAVLFYQAATFASHPVSSTRWIMGIAAVLVAAFWGMRYLGRRDEQASSRHSRRLMSLRNLGRDDMNDVVGERSEIRCCLI